MHRIVELILLLCFLIGSFSFTWFYMGFHATVIYPVLGRRPRACPNGDMIATPHGRVEAMKYSIGVSPLEAKVTARLVCGEDDFAGTDVVLPVHECPGSWFFEPHVLHTFINRQCLPLAVAQEAFDRLTVRPDDPLYPPDSFVVYERPWDQSLRYTFAYYDLSDAPVGNFYIHLKSDGYQLYEQIDSFVERIYRNATIPTSEDIGSNRFASILHGIPLSRNRWTNYVEYNRDWQKLIYTVLMERSEEYPECSICLESRRGPKTYVHCGHGFHTSCVGEWKDVSGKNECPLCRTRNII
jgi:hypothetical protein